MSSSPIRVINQALILLGENLIQSLDEDTTEAKVASTFYPDALDHCLRDIKPSFAKKRSEGLVEVTTPTFGYEHAYELPQECLAVVAIDFENADSNSVRNRAWAVEGTRLLCNIGGGVKIAFIEHNDSTEGLMDSSFIKALAAYLAYEFAYPLTNDEKKVTTAYSIYEARADDARAVYALENSVIQTQNTQLIQVR